MKLIGITPRVDVHPDHGERRDALDQQWFKFLNQCGYLAILLPNNKALLDSYLNQLSFAGIVLSGGNSASRYGGDAIERDQTDHELIQWCLANKTPLIGVCRGMQSIQIYYQHILKPVKDHISRAMLINDHGVDKIVNSYHNLATFQSLPPLVTTATSADGVIKAIEHQTAEIKGIMWHPERNMPFSSDDIELFQELFK